MFAVNSFIAQKWWMKNFLGRFFDGFSLDPTNPIATKSLISEIKKNKKCVIFSEGRTVTGSLMKIYEGPGMIADKSDAMILPNRIDGAQYSKLSKLKGKVRTRLFPKITLTILEPVKFEVAKEITGRNRRKANGDKAI